MAKFRKKPVVIEAEQFTKDSAWKHINNDIPIFGKFSVSGSWNAGDHRLNSVWISIPTLEGTMRADLNDWIIKGVKGEFYPCKPDIFEATYEPAE